MPDQPPAPVASRRYSGRAMVAGLAAGFVAAAVICVALAAGGVLPGQQKDSDGGGGGSTAAISLPAHFLSYAQLPDIPIANKSDSGRKNIAAQKAENRDTAAALSAAHHGAGAAVEGYGSTELDTLFSVWAVRDATPAPVVQVVSAERLGLAVASEVVRTFGDVSCDIRYDGITKGQQITPDHTHTVLCQRSSSSLTVAVHGPGGDVGGHPEQVAAMVDAVWSQLS